MLAPEDDGLILERGLGIGDVVHAEPGQDDRDHDERHPDKAGVLQPQRFLDPLLHIVQALTREAAHHGAGDHQRHHELRQAHPQVANARVEARGRALLRLRVEEADVGHAGAEVAAPQTTQRGQDQQRAVAGAAVLQRDAHAHGRQQQTQRGDHRPAAPAEDGHHEAVEDPQRGTRKRRQCGQPEQLVAGEPKAHLVEVDRHHAPQHPDGERERQRDDRDPEIAPRDARAGALPELGVLRIPMMQDVSLHGGVVGCRHGDLPVSSTSCTSCYWAAALPSTPSASSRGC